MTSFHRDRARARGLAAGAAFWLVFSVVAVALRGVRWDETWEHALVITRMAPYPEGHPMYLYCRNVFSGQSYFSALLLWCFDAPLLINGLRNVAQLAFCAAPVFLIGARLGGGAIAGHLATVFVLAGVHRNFQSYYPIETWPHFYSVGQIGLGYALLALGCALHGWWRAAGLLIGLMPVVHIGQIPAIAIAAGLMAIAAWTRGDGTPLRGGGTGLGIGLLISVFFFLVYRQYCAPLPDGGAYAAEGDARAIWLAYSKEYDLHRFTPRLNPFWKSAIGAGMTLALVSTAVSAFRSRAARDTSGYSGVRLYVLSVIGLTGAIWVLQRVLGDGVPFLLIGWMPYRLTNHLAVLLAPVALGVLARSRAGLLLAAGALAYAILDPVWAAILPEPWFIRYAGNPELIVFLLSGAALAAAHERAIRRGRVAWWGAVFAAALAPALAWLYPFGFAAAAAGAAGWAIARWLVGRGVRLGPPVRRRAVVAAGLMLLGALTLREWRGREQLPMHPLQARVAEHLAESGEASDMIVTPWWDIQWLGRTRHPILADYQTAHLMTYMPGLAPAIRKLHHEVFGHVLDGASGPPLADWPARPPDEWARLGRAYGFTWVLSPSALPLQLDLEIEGEPYNLYRVTP